MVRMPMLQGSVAVIIAFRASLLVMVRMPMLSGSVVRAVRVVRLFDVGEDAHVCLVQMPF